MKTLQANQIDAVNYVVQTFRGTRVPAYLPNGSAYKFPAQQAVILYGGTGCGKTLIATAASIKLNEKCVLVIAPPCGGVVLRQWWDEIEEAGHGDRACLYHGPGRVDGLASWRATCNAATAGVHFVVTSIATLHADAGQLLKRRFPERTRNGEDALRKKYSELETRWAYSSAAAALGKFDLIIIDEFQEFRNGSPPSDEKRAIDTTKSFYVMLDAVAAFSSPLVLGLSATPVVNSSGELYSFLRLAHKRGTVHDPSAKMAILERTRQNVDPDLKRLFKVESRRIRSHMIVPVTAPIVPLTTYENVTHTYNFEEASVLSAAYGELYTATVMFLAAMVAFLEQPENPARRAKKELSKNRFLSQLTISKRMTLAPLCFVRPRNRAPNPFEDPQYDSLGHVVFTTDASGAKLPLGRLLPFDVAAAHAAVPLNKISKFSALIHDLAKLTDRRSMVICEFSDPIELLALYLRDAFPGRSIFKFHGRISGRDKQLAAFKNSPVDAILLATRGACGMAINVECTTRIANRRHAVVQYQLDLPMAQSTQSQAEGRIKRPIAQGHPCDADKVDRWIVKTVKADFNGKHTLEDWLQEVMALKNARCADMLTDRDEEQIDGRETSIDTNEGLDGPLKMLIGLFGIYAPPEAPRKKARVEVSKFSSKKMCLTT